MSTLDWRPFFPLETPRPEQVTALDALCSAIEDGKKILVAELGTGVGKSAVAVCLSRWMAAREDPPTGFQKGAVVLTSQKVLQDQYVKDFAEARDLRSAQNFPCSGPLGGTCGETWRVRKAVGKAHAATLQCTPCPYRIAKDEFALSQIGVTNYSYFLSEAVYAGELPMRQLLVLDEAHNVEDEVRRWSTVEISENEADQHKEVIPAGGTDLDAMLWLRQNFKGKIEHRLGFIGGRLQKMIGSGQLLDKIVPRLAEENDRLDKRKCQINRLMEYGGEVLVSRHVDREGKKSIRFQPVQVGGLAHEILYSRATTTLLMSATILDKKIFSKCAGLRDPAYVQVPTPFKAAAFGMRLRSVGKMSRPDIEKSMLNIPRAIQQILKDNPNEKGIIHTVSYKIAQEVAKANNPRLLVQTCGEDREWILKRHLLSKDPTVMVSPAMMEGLDLRDDLGRFQVICKIPYPDMSDPIVKKKDWDWYAWRTVRSLVQAAGRSVRSDTDWTRTYILDECFLDIMHRNGHLLPKHITEALEVEEPF